MFVVPFLDEAMLAVTPPLEEADTDRSLNSTWSTLISQSLCSLFPRKYLALNHGKSSLETPETRLTYQSVFWSSITRRLKHLFLLIPVNLYAAAVSFAWSTLAVTTLTGKLLISRDIGMDLLLEIPSYAF